MKKNVIMRDKILILLVSVIISLMMKDAVSTLAEAFLPEKNISIIIVPCQDGNVREVTMPFENHSNELFSLFRDKILKDGKGNILDGWRYTEGELGVSWTRMQSSEEGAEITIAARTNPNSYFAVFSDMWSGAFRMTVDGCPIKEEYIDFYQDKTDTDLVYIKPFENDKTFLYIRIILHFFAIGILFFIITEFLKNIESCESQISNLLSELRKESLYPYLLVISNIVFFSMLFLFVNQARGYFRSDLVSHIKAGLDGHSHSSICYTLLAIPYFLGREVGCGIYLALLVFLTMLLAGVYIKNIQKMNSKSYEINWSYSFLLGIAVCFMGGIYIPNVFPVLYLHHNYTGPGTAASICTQPWHNSSYILMRFFALITMLQFWKIRSKYFDGKIKISEWISFAVLIFLTTAVKPNFIMAFAPAMLVMLILDTFKKKGRYIIRSFILGAGVLVAIPVMLYQQGMIFNASSEYVLTEPTKSAEIVNGIGITTSIIEKMIKDGVLLPMLISGLSFFAFVTILCFMKGEINEHLWFSWLMLFFSLMEYWFFIEGGGYAAAGNFGWGVPFCSLLLMISCIERLIVLKSKLNKSIVFLVVTPLVLMIMTGVCYYAYLLGGGDFVM